MAPNMSSKWALEASKRAAGEMKTFNVRVAIVEPGIVDTAMARRIGDRATDSPTGSARVFHLFFSESLKNPVPPSLVADNIISRPE